jgi:hypothetical protein
MVGLHIKAKATKLLTNIRKNIFDLVLGESFLDMTVNTKGNLQKEKLIKSDII